MRDGNSSWRPLHHSRSSITVQMPDDPLGSTIVSANSATRQDVQQGTPNPQERRRPIRSFFTDSEESRSVYLKYGVPLYEGSLKCDWETTEAILDAHPEYVTYSITDNDETTLHIAASAKGSKKVVEFVKNLMTKFPALDLTLVNKDNNTALHLAAAAGNGEVVEFMLGENADLLNIRGVKDTTPLYAAALYGNDKVVEYLYGESQGLVGWTNQKRSWLLDKCVESDMFDTALKIVKDIQNRDNVDRSNVLKDIVLESNVLGILARKPEAFRKKESNIIRRTIKSVSAFIRKTTGTPETESEALQLLKIFWKECVLKLSKKDVDAKLRGPVDSVKSDSVRIIRIRLYNHLTKLLQETEKITNEEGQVSKLRNLVSEHVEDMHAEIQTLSKENKMDSGKGDQALQLQKRISEYIVNIHDETKGLIDQAAQNPDQLHNLKELIYEKSKYMRDETENAKAYSSRVLFVAAEVGNTTFLVELIRLCPDLIWKVNDNNQTMFHIAVKHRHEGIYNLLYEIGKRQDQITPMIDREGNNMLHLVGKSAKEKRLDDVSGAALQVQRQLLWFQELYNMIPPSYRERKNKDGLTPHELFTKEHKEQLSQGEKWMTGTASKCMVVATLIATMVFAAAFTIPGGYIQSDDHNKDKGLPLFRSKATFVVFVVADAISLFSSSGSILIFLSILTSRYAERDFLESIPNKLMAGLATLFISIATMLLAFSISFFVLYQQDFIWIPILIAVFAVLPGILYLFLQHGLFFDIIRSTYGSRYLFKPKKRVLYD